MERILHRTFDGLVPRLEPSMLGENAAQIAQDVDLRRGVLTPVLGRAPDDREGYDCGATARTIYLWRYTDWTLTLGTVGELDPAEWIALAATAGFKLTIDGTDYQIVPDFSFGVSGINSVAHIIENAIRAVTNGVERVEWVGTTGTEHMVIYGCASVTSISAPTGKVDLSAAGWMHGPGTSAAVSGEKWLDWAGDVNVVAGPINDDAYSRVYYTGDGVPKMRLRMAGSDVARTMKIEAPAKPTLTGTTYTAGSPSAAMSAFTISEAKIALFIDGTMIDEPNMTYTKTGDTIVFDSNVWVADCAPYVSSIGSSPWMRVNGIWFEARDGASVESADGAYRMVVQWTTWIVWFDTTLPTRANGMSVRDRFSWHGAMKLLYQDVVAGTNDAANSSHPVSYCVAYVTDIGEEGPLSPASNVFLSSGTATVTVGGMSVPADSDRGITLLRIYRSANGSFLWRADLPIGTSPLTYADTTVAVDDALGEAASLDTKNPPDELQGIIACAGGWYAAFRGREFLASEPFIPTSWPDAYRATVQAPIVALASTGNDTFVMTQGRPVMMSGSDPSTLTAVNIESDQACVSAAGVVLLGQQVLYPSPDGLVAMYSGASRLITAEWYRREDWQALVPESIRAAAHDGRYYALLAGVSTPILMVMDFGESVDRVTMAEGADVVGLYSDLQDDTLYVIENDEVCVWRGGTDALQFDWRGRDWLYPKPVSFGAMRVLATAYTVPEVPEEGPPPLDTRPLVTLYANGAEVLSHRVTSAKAFRLPRLRPERRWSLRIQSAVEVSEVTLATGMEALLSR